MTKTVNLPPRPIGKARGDQLSVSVVAPMVLPHDALEHFLDRHLR